ncbi:MAG: hypothetical protein WCK51_08575 [Armatimonadota bacterium]
MIYLPPYALQESEYIGRYEISILSFKATDRLELKVKYLTSRTSGIIKVRDTILFEDPQLRKQLAAFFEKQKNGWMVKPENGYDVPIPTRSNKLAKYDLQTELVLRGLALNVYWGTEGYRIDGGVSEAKRKKLGVYAFDAAKQQKLFLLAKEAQKRMLGKK